MIILVSGKTTGWSYDFAPLTRLLRRCSEPLPDATRTPVAQNYPFPRRGTTPTDRLVKKENVLRLT